MTVDCQRSVLIVGRSEETRDVLQTALERRGLRILSAGQATAGLELARQHHPDLIVLDLESADGENGDVPADFASQTNRDQAPLVVLGTLKRRQRPAEGEFVPKPYHFGPLIRRIEELLDNSPKTSTAAARRE